MLLVTEQVRVQCYSGHTYAQEPRKIVTRDGGIYRVRRVLVRSREPMGPRFVVLPEERTWIDIQYAEEQDRWYLMGKGSLGTVEPSPAEAK